ncbi:hypothetical protein MKY30_22255 [Oceanobacillus sp. FSL W8-0428]|uniref:DUF7973 domain-containing protein n=1 Tax=Oceanobacillus sojae TaxID=582851 RepID=A0A511ZKV7_9BACI|nr:hypothetical protein [Oceanobacillus sojae]GEN88056.1 hypothetical protein OSO01_27950 [Oceanobacillus sojae]
MSLVAILAAFGGGVFGALIGGTTAFIFTGFLGMAGVAAAVAAGSTLILDYVAFGPFFGPHVAFVGAVAAAAYAGRISKKHLESATFIDNPVNARTILGDHEDKDKIFAEDDRHVDGADTTVPLFKTTDPMVLIVGGIFGILGYFVEYLYGPILGIPIDTIALTVVTFAIITRFLFGHSGLTGIFPTDEKRFPFSGKMLLFNAIWGFAFAGLVGYAAIALDIDNIGFTISAASLIFLYFGLKFPVSHHVSMVAGHAAIALASPWLAALFGLFAVITGEYVQRLFNTHVDTHIDMPAIVIAFWSFIVLGVIAPFI